MALANKILSVVVDERFGVGHHLKEQHLAEILGVSRTPVRAALRLLADRKIVAAIPNRGFRLQKDGRELLGTTLDVPPLIDEKLYLDILGDRLSGSLPPTVNQVMLTKRYGIGRGSLRPVLNRLAEEGLITRKGQNWLFLPSLESESSLRASYDLRITLEPAGLLLDSFRVDRGVLRHLRDRHSLIIEQTQAAPVPGRSLFMLDSQFHETMAEASGNPFFLQVVQQQNKLRRLFEYQGYANSARVREWCGEHLAVIEALERGDRAAAAGTLRDHLQRAAATAMVQSRSRAT
ncbi:FCD domain-containing protein [Azospirillum sp. ST 5-10]